MCPLLMIRWTQWLRFQGGVHGMNYFPHREHDILACYHREQFCFILNLRQMMYLHIFMCAQLHMSTAVCKDLNLTAPFTKVHAMCALPLYIF